MHIAGPMQGRHLMSNEEENKGGKKDENHCSNNVVGLVKCSKMTKTLF